MINFLRQRSFLLVLVAVLVSGIGWPAAMRPVANWLPSDVIVAAVTFIMALPLQTSALVAVVRRPGPAWLGAAINCGLAPPLGWLASQALPPDLAIGVILAATVPCTLATAAVWTRRAGGNDAVAFLVTMLTNLACFFVVPAWLWMLVGVHADVNFRQIVVSLLVLVVLPIIVAQILRQIPAIGSRATAHRQLLSRLAQFGVLLMVFVGAVACGEKLQSVDDPSLFSIANIAILIAAVTSVHVALLIAGWRLCRMFGVELADAIAVAFAGSQKTLMVGAYLAAAIGPLAIVPMVAYHAAQLVIDTLVADWLRQGKPLLTPAASLADAE
jgi:solute carrier family 10 (sodium/bile acid cotransporter), member 7